MEIERKREMGVSMREELCMRDRDIDKQERRASVSKSRYNADYRKIITETIPKYLDRESAKEKKIIARFRCGNEERNNKFWVSEGERMCRMCGEGRETIEHNVQMRRLVQLRSNFTKSFDLFNCTNVFSSEHFLYLTR